MFAKQAALLVVAALLFEVKATTTMLNLRGKIDGAVSRNLQSDDMLCDTEVSRIEAIEPKKCFQSTAELYAAVDDYMEDSSQFSTVASEYGWPIGTWCVRDVTNMQNVFNSFSRNRDLETFNEDISDWDVSNVVSMENMFKNAEVRVIKIRLRPLFCQSII